MKEIKTERLILKKPEYKDKQSIISQIGDREVAKSRNSTAGCIVGHRDHTRRIT